MPSPSLVPKNMTVKLEEVIGWPLQSFPCSLSSDGEWDCHSVLLLLSPLVGLGRSWEQRVTQQWWQHAQVQAQQQKGGGDIWVPLGLGQASLWWWEGAVEFP